VSYPSDLLDLNLLLLAQRSQREFVAADVRQGAGVKLSGSVVMAGAEIGGGAELTECLVFPGTKVPAGRVRRRTILTTDAEIRCAPDDA
jgi:ADP-glucose pyrophosphorylase